MLISKKHKSLIFVGHDNFSSSGWVQGHQSAVLINLNAANHMLFHSNLLLVIYFFSRRVAFRTLSRFTEAKNRHISYLKTISMRKVFTNVNHIQISMTALNHKEFEFLQSTEWYSQLEYQLVYYRNERLIFKDSPIKTWLNKILFKTRFKLLIYFDPLSSDNLFFLVCIVPWTVECFAATK